MPKSFPDSNFSLPDSIINIEPRLLDETLISSSNHISLGSEVVGKNGKEKNRYTIISNVAKGGEGEIYTIKRQHPFNILDEKLVVKIYNSNCRVAWRHDKIIEMLSMNLNVKNVIWPQFAIYNKGNQFVGYSMKKVDGFQLQTSVFGKAKLNNHFPRWSRRDLILLCLSITKTIETLHKKNILLGDINPYNFLVKSPDEVYFVDTDSYQFKDFPCPVGSEPYRAPEIKNSSYKTFLRTKNHEYFALAILIFTILLPGKRPFAHQGGEGVRENIKKGNFPYITNPNNIPLGPWGHIWSHLPLEIRELFKEAFTEKRINRPSPTIWKLALSSYLNELMTPMYRSDLELFPKSYRPLNGQKTKIITCPKCKESYTVSQEEAHEKKINKNTLCNHCKDVKAMVNHSGGAKKTCLKCAKTFKILIQDLEKFKKEPHFCDHCLLKKTLKKRYCKSCKKNFHLSLDTVKMFLFELGLKLPKKCPSCLDYSLLKNINQQELALVRFDTIYSDDSLWGKYKRLPSFPKFLLATLSAIILFFSIKLLIIPSVIWLWQLLIIIIDYLYLGAVWLFNLVVWFIKIFFPGVILTVVLGFSYDFLKKKQPN